VCLFVGETTSKLKSYDLIDSVIYGCAKNTDSTFQGESVCMAIITRWISNPIKQKMADPDDGCNVPDMWDEDESGFHAVLRCTKAAALQHEMRKQWWLPGEQQFCESGPDWLILLLHTVDKDAKALILMLLWRAWHFVMIWCMGRDGRQLQVRQKF
jgi:hypothetical protein